MLEHRDASPGDSADALATRRRYHRRAAITPVLPIATVAARVADIGTTERPGAQLGSEAFADVIDAISASITAEARAGIEPANSGFADRCLTTWLPRREPEPTRAPELPQGSGDADTGATTVSRLRIALDHVGDGVIEASRDGRVLWINNAARALLGIGPDHAFAGQPVGDFLASYAAPVLQAAAVHAATSGAWIGETIVRHTGGGELPVTLVLVAHRGATGDVDGWSYVLQELAASPHSEPARDQSHKYEAVGRLAGGIAHDFQNVLSTIIATSEAMLLRLTSDNADRADVETIRTASERAANLTRQLLAYSRRQALVPRVLDVNGVVTGMRDMIRRLLPAPVRLTCELAPALGLVKVDHGQLEQVLLNLTVNARDAMPRGGVLTVRTFDVVHAATDTARAIAPPGHYVALQVTDTGVGIPTDALPQIFDPFFTTKPGQVGAGLGLASVMGIIKQSGGFVWGESASGEGASFTIWLPRYEGELPAAADSAVTAHNGVHETILLVDPDDGLRGMAARLLRRGGYMVLEAGDGAEALAILSRTSGAVHLLLSAVTMPHMNGVELACIVRAARANVRVLLATGTMAELHGLGAGDLTHSVLCKPHRPSVLLDAVRASLDGAM